MYQAETVVSYTMSEDFELTKIHQKDFGGIFFIKLCTQKNILQHSPDP